VVFVVVDLVGVVEQFECAVFAMERDTRTHRIDLTGVTAAAFPEDGFAISKVKGCDLRVRSLPIVLILIASAAGIGFYRRVFLQTPAGQIQEMDAVVHDFAGSPVPLPMPVVVDEVVFIILPWSWTLPKFVVQPIRNRGDLTCSDALSGIGVPGPGIINSPDCSAGMFL